MPEADELAAHLAFRLQRLEAMRFAAKGLFRLPQTGQAVFKRGMPEGLRSRTTPLYGAEIFDILQAYGNSRARVAITNHKVPKPLILSLEDARVRLRRALGGISLSEEEWVASVVSLTERLTVTPHDKSIEQEIRLLEALLFAAVEPIDIETLRDRMPEETDVGALLARLARDYAGRGVNLVRVANRWRFQTAPDLEPSLVCCRIQRHN